MNFPRLLLVPVWCALTAPVHGAGVQYLSDLRLVAGGVRQEMPGAAFSLFDAAVADGAGQAAAQRSEISAGRVEVVSSVAGGGSLGMSVLQLHFRLAEPGPWAASGSFTLLGESGFACVSLIDLPRRQILYLNEAAGEPPAAAVSRTWQAGGWLPAGDYELEAIIHAGGTGPAHSGRMDMVFTVPEPGVLLFSMLAGGMMLPVLRRRSAAVIRAGFHG